MNYIQNEKLLVCYPELGYCYYDVDSNGVYDKDYFDKYKNYSGTEFAKCLNDARTNLVNKYYSGELVDIGIGSGDFIQARFNTLGYDVNPFGIEWLKSRDQWCDPYVNKIKAASCWDSLEHIKDPSVLLSQVEEWLFVSIPIFNDCSSVVKSKHYRKDEHYHYFTHNGFIKFMAFYGFDMLEFNQMETDIGRDGINSYVFRRRP